MFITFEGPEGSGKSTAIEAAAKWLYAEGWKVVVTREPGGSRLGQALRCTLLELKNQDMNDLTELFLYLADRAQHVSEVLTPALTGYKTIVLCDRYIDSTVAYQGYGRGLDIGILERLNSLAASGLKPELTLLFDLPVEIGLERARRRNTLSQNKEGRFEAEELAFHQRVRAGFLKLASAEPERFVIIQADLKPEVVFERVKQTIATRLPVKMNAIK